jgi:hypothetical protein
LRHVVPSRRETRGAGVVNEQKGHPWCTACMRSSFISHSREPYALYMVVAGLYGNPPHKVYSSSPSEVRNNIAISIKQKLERNAVHLPRRVRARSMLSVYESVAEASGKMRDLCELHFKQWVIASPRSHYKSEERLSACSKFLTRVTRGLS